MNQEKKNKNVTPRYQQIAVAVATRIASEEYKEGDKIYARSSLASQYRVSPETARRAICVLSDLNIVTTEKGSGVTIKSCKNAADFVKQYHKRRMIDTIKKDLQESISRQKSEMEQMNTYLSELISATEHFRSFNPFMPFQVQITRSCVHIDKTVSDIQFWQHTGATVIAVKREDSIMVSPGPYIVLQDGDVLYFTTQDDSPQRVKDFLYLQKSE
ncbi:MAG: TrkA C-terminal domain-containing protein [Christensenella sp.]|uniref:TrkA C-terminal domain-containing protein n=1 Tax=Christensenella sp. TaxID=1935934 RepID=UPI002B1F14DF|nr:TrkA C-terminal domain-containing protein [Christensenella sp.]MEA5003158.1 TrkA C-terminal domain-containing protein [Christensenella sp.]